MAYNDNYYRPGGSFSLFPPVIKNLIIINVAVHIVLFLMDIGRFAIPFEGSVYPASTLIRFFFALRPLGEGFQIWQILTYQFLHADLTHLFFNMFALWMFGAEIENYWGSKKFAIFYLVCGIGAGVFHLMISQALGAMAPTIGASGAVYGILIAFAMFFPDRLIYIYFILPVKAKYLIGFYIIMEFLAVGSVSTTAHLAHIGGALFGFLLVMLDRNFKFNFGGFKKNKYNNKAQTIDFEEFKGRVSPFNRKKNIEEVDFEEVDYSNRSDIEEVSQEEIDKILDKISRTGYQNLSESEKEVLFKASKKK